MTDQPNFAKRCPADVYPTPECVLKDVHLERGEKIDLLRRWAYDELELEVAESEGMSGGERSRLPEVLRALERVAHEDRSMSA